MLPGYSVAVPTWMRARQLRGCLEGVVSQVPAPQEVLVLGHDADADARAVANEFNAVWIDVPRRGAFPPIRSAADAATCPLLAIVDDDAVPRPGWAAALLAEMETATVACAGGAVRVDDRPPRRMPTRPGELSWYGRLSGGLEWAYGPPRVVATVMEGNWLWRTGVLRTLVFDPAFEVGEAINYGLDLTLQAMAAGWTVVLVPAAEVDHMPGERDVGNQRSAVQRQYLAGRNRTHILFTRLSGWRRWIALAWWWGVGDAHSYGIARFVQALIRRQDAVGARAAAAARGRLHAAAAHGASCPRYEPPSVAL